MALTFRIKLVWTIFTSRAGYSWVIFYEVPIKIEARESSIHFAPLTLDLFRAPEGSEFKSGPSDRDILVYEAPKGPNSPGPKDQAQSMARRAMRLQLA